MKKLKVAIIGQGRSGRNIHGQYFLSDGAPYYQVVAVVDQDEERRKRALEEYPGCQAFAQYQELFGMDLDLVVNATFSELHYPISKDLLEHDLPVLVEKPMARNFEEATDLIRIAKEHNVFFAVFQQSFLMPHYVHLKETIASGKLGRITQVNIAYSGFERRWDWQTQRSHMGGCVYNTGPHPLGFALDLLDFSDDAQVVYSKLDRVLASGDAADVAKIILAAPGKPVVDVEINSNDAFNDFKLKVLGSRGTYKTTVRHYQMKYIVDGENPEQPEINEPLANAEGLPSYCTEKLIFHEEEGDFDGVVTQVSKAKFYEMVYYAITEGKPLSVKPEDIAKLVGVIETIHAQNPAFAAE